MIKETKCNECGKYEGCEDYDIFDYVQSKGWFVDWKDVRPNADFERITFCKDCVSKIIREHLKNKEVK